MIFQALGKALVSFCFVFWDVKLYIYHEKKDYLNMTFAGINAIVFLVLFEGFRI